MGKKEKVFKLNIGYTIKDERRDLVVISQGVNSSNKKSYKFHCNKCGYDGWIREDALIGQTQGCPCCCRNPRIVVEGINDIPTISPWMVKYFQGGYDEAKMYTKSSGQSIYPICPDCGEVRSKKIKISDIYRNHSIACVCGDKISIPEKMMYNILNQLGVRFVFQLTKKDFSWCDKYRYDFYIQDINTIIETHGMQHYNNSYYYSVTNWSSNSDIIKYNIANNNGITNYIIIDCRYSDVEYIKSSILKSDLSKMYDLSTIDWVECEEFIYKNLIKEICNYWNDKSTDKTTKDLSSIFNLTVPCIQKYLKMGNKLSWCSYTAREEMKKTAFKNGKNNSKAINVFKNGQFVCDCLSATEFSKISEEIIQVKCTQSGINLSILENRDYKGYTFKYKN